MSSQKKKVYEIYNICKKKISEPKCQNNQFHQGKKSFCAECKIYLCENCSSKHTKSHQLTPTDV